jgi:hypothetical protein
MVQDKWGRIISLTNEIKNNSIIYNKSGKLAKFRGHVARGNRVYHYFK